MRASALKVWRAVAYLAVFALPTVAFAQPASDAQRRIRIIVPFGTGTGADLAARVIGERLADRIKQPVIIENRPGGSAMIGVNALKSALPDGMTLGVLASGNAAQPWLVKEVPFDIRKDFIPLTLMYSAPLVLTVATSFPAQTLAEFVAYAKAHPGKLSYGTLGAGTITHLAAELLVQSAGLEMTQIPYKGSGEIHTAVASGDVSMSFDNYVSPKPLVDAGRLRVLAVTSSQRLAVLPNVPTLAETYPGVEIGLWTGLAVPNGTPKSVVDQLTRDLRAVMQEPAVKQYITRTGARPGGGSPEEFRDLISTDFERFGRIIRKAGIKTE